MDIIHFYHTRPFSPLPTPVFSQGDILYLCVIKCHAPSPVFPQSLAPGLVYRRILQCARGHEIPGLPSVNQTETPRERELSPLVSQNCDNVSDSFPFASQAPFWSPYVCRTLSQT